MAPRMAVAPGLVWRFLRPDSGEAETASAVADTGRVPGPGQALDDPDIRPHGHKREGALQEEKLTDRN